MHVRLEPQLVALALLALAGCQTPWTFRADCPEQPDTDFFGHSLAVDGVLALVGNDDSADLYARPRDGTPLPPHLWIHAERFTPTRGSAPGLYGHAVALEGNLLAIGAPWGEPSVTDNGYVDVYELIGNDWTFVQKVVPTSFDPPPAYGPEIHFGTAIVFQGDELFVAARHWGDTAGRVFVFERVGGVYQQTHELQPSVDIQETSFGDALSVSGDTLAIGRAGGGGAGTGGGSPLVPGEVHVYVKIDGAWALQQVLLSPSPVVQDDFGSSLELHGDRLVVNDQDSLHMFERTAGVWSHLWERPVETQQGQLPVAYQPASASAPAYAFAATIDAVRVYVEAVDPADPFILEGTLFDPDSTPGFGKRMARTDDRLVVGTGPDFEGPSRVRVFERELPAQARALAAERPDWAAAAPAIERAVAEDPELRRRFERALRSESPARQALQLAQERGLVASERARPASGPGSRP